MLSFTCDPKAYSWNQLKTFSGTGEKMSRSLLTLHLLTNTNHTANLPTYLPLPNPSSLSSSNFSKKMFKQKNYVRQSFCWRQFQKVFLSFLCWPLVSCKSDHPSPVFFPLKVKFSSFLVTFLFRQCCGLQFFNYVTVKMRYLMYPTMSTRNGFAHNPIGVWVHCKKININVGNFSQ